MYTDSSQTMRHSSYGTPAFVNTSSPRISLPETIQETPKLSARVPTSDVVDEKPRLARVLYEFRPSLPDEMEVEVGQLIWCTISPMEDGWVDAQALNSNEIDAIVNLLDDRGSLEAYWYDLTCSGDQNKRPRRKGVVPYNYLEFLIPFTPKISETATSASESDRQRAESKLSMISTTSLDKVFLPNRSVYRFAPFVTSGAEEFILTGGLDVPDQLKSHFSVWNSVSSTLSAPADQLHLSAVRLSEPQHQPEGAIEIVNTVTEEENQQLSPFFITDGPAWLDESKDYHVVRLAQPLKRYSTLKNFIVYRIHVTTRPLHLKNHYSVPLYSALFQDNTNSSDSKEGAENEGVWIFRRYSHFALLHQYLVTSYPMLHIPPLPPKSYSITTRTSSSYESTQKRMRALERWIGRILGHFILRNDQAVEAFLYAGARAPSQVQDETDESVRGGDEGESFVEAIRKVDREPALTLWQRIFHPSFNLFPDSFGDKYQTLASIFSFRRKSKPTESGMSAFYAPSHDIAEDLTGDYATLRQLMLFMEKTQTRLIRLNGALEGYRDTVLNSLRRDTKRVVCALQRLLHPTSRPGSASASGVEVAHHPAPSPTRPVSTDDTEDTVEHSDEQPHVRDTSHQPTHPFTPPWCHIPNCTPCSLLTGSIHSLTASLSHLSNDSIPNQVQQVSELMEWIDEWCDAGSCVKGYVQGVHLGAARLGREVARAMRMNREAYLDLVEDREHHHDPSQSQSQSQSIDAVSSSFITHPSLPSHLEPSSMLHRLSTVYNLTHAEMNHWFHRQRQVEFLGMVDGFVTGQVRRCERELAVWRECAERVQSVKRDLVDTRP